MGKIIDSNALYNIGRSTSGDIRDNRARDAAMAFVGVKALSLIGNAFVTRQNGRKKGAQTMTNAKNEIKDSDYDMHIQNIATDEVNSHKKMLMKAANLEAIGQVQRAVEIRNQVDSELKRLKQGADLIKSKDGIFKQIYEKGTFTTSKGDMKIAINPASSAMSQQHGASFADGSIHQSFDFMEYDGKKQWVLIGENSNIDLDKFSPTTNITGSPKKKTEITYTPLSELELPELNEKKVLLDYIDNNSVDLQKAGQRSKEGVFDEEGFRNSTFNNVNEMTPNQLSSFWYSPSGDEISAPVLKYITQPGGFMLDGQKHPPILDPKEEGLDSSELQYREYIATGTMEKLKNEDWTSHEKVSWLVDNEIMPSAKDAFQKGFNNRPEKVTKPQKEGQVLLDGQQYLTIAQARSTANKMSQEGDISYSKNNARKFENVGDGMVELSYLDTDRKSDGYGKYFVAEKIPVNQALSLRGVGSNFTGLNFETKEPEGFRTQFVNDESDKDKTLYETYFGPSTKSKPVDFKN